MTMEILGTQVVLESELNALGQPVGLSVGDWTPPPKPSRAPMLGRYCRLEALDPARHAEALYTANALDAAGHQWTYLPYGPFADFAAYRAWVAQQAASEDPLFYAIVDLADETPVGVASYLRIDPLAGSIEVGWLHFSPAMQQSRLATAAMVLMMANAFALGYRRYEWKCDSLNATSRRAAERYGFQYAGLFRQATLYKGRNRDTAWYAMTDRDWPAVKAGFQAWLDPANFDAEGRQRSSLEACRSA